MWSLFFYDLKDLPLHVFFVEKKHLKKIIEHIIQYTIYCPLYKRVDGKPFSLKKP